MVFWLFSGIKKCSPIYYENFNFLSKFSLPPVWATTRLANMVKRGFLVISFLFVSPLVRAGLRDGRIREKEARSSAVLAVLITEPFGNGFGWSNWWFSDGCFWGLVQKPFLPRVYTIASLGQCPLQLASQNFPLVAWIPADHPTQRLLSWSHPEGPLRVC